MRSVHLALALVSTSALALAAPAYAQTDARPTTDPTAPEASDGPPPSADGSEAQGEEVIVTGSRIARPNYDTVEPVIVTTSKDIEDRGFTTLGQALNEQPSFGVPGASPVGGQSAFGPGQNFVDFFSLGSQRTLTLVNSRRFVGSNNSSIFGPTGSGGNQVDLNIIPTKLIDRVETIAVGGAPIYGSDAIAGTVNIVLKRNYEGINLDGQYGISDRGDARDYRFRVLAGTNFAGGRGNIVVSGEYNKSDGLLATDRPITSTGDFFAGRTATSEPFRQRIFPDRRIPSISEAGIPLIGNAVGLGFPLAPYYEAAFGLPAGADGAVRIGGQDVKFDSAGNLIPIDYGNRVGLPTALGLNASGGNGFSLVPLTNLLTNIERYNAVALGQFQVTDNVRVFAEGWYTRSKGTNLRDQPEYNTGAFDLDGTPAGNFILSTDNPFLSASTRTAILNAIATNPFSDQRLGATITGSPVQDYFYLGRANTDLVSGQATGKVEVYRGVLGLDGSISPFGDRQLKWEVVGNYGRSKTTSRSFALATRNLLNALDAVAGPNGTIICRPGGTRFPTENFASSTASISNTAAPTISNTCAPLNPFGVGQASRAARDYVTAVSTPEALNEQAVFTASIAGPVASLPGGNLSFALGYEHRYERQQFDPGAFLRGGPDNTPLVDENGDGNPNNDPSSFGQTVPIVGIDANFHTNEVFGEIAADLIGPDQNIPLVRALEFKGAARYVDNSLSGGDFTWTAGGRWQPFRDLTIRGNFTRSIRSPSITEFANPSQNFFGFATDPCDQDEVVNGPNPAQRRANCVAAGVVNPDTFSALSNQRSFPQGVAGDPTLSAEKANSWTIGVLLQPTFLRGFTASVDYVDIKIKDVITDFSADQVLAACYDSNNFATNPFCARTSRDTRPGAGANANQLDFVLAGYANQSQLRYKGIISNVAYNFDAPFLSETGKLGANVQYQYLDTLGSQTVGGAFVNNAGVIGLSRHKGLANFTYNDDSFGALIGLSYLGKARYSNIEAPDARTPDRVGDVLFVNTSINFNVAERFQLRFVIDNLFDTKPPFPSPVGGGTITYFRGILGRYFRVGTSVRF